MEAQELARAAAALLIIAPAPLTAQTAPPPAATVEAAPELKTRVDELVALLQGRGSYDALFHPTFQAAVPKARFDPIVAQLTAQLGQPVGVERITPRSRYAAEIGVGFERGIASMTIALDAAAPYQVVGLLVTGVTPRDDSLDKAAAEVRALPGRAAFGVWALGDGAPRLVAGHEPDAAGAIGSAFKLWVLAEAARQVRAGTRRWDEVIPLSGPRSLPSGLTQDWPEGAPVTLHTLATLMISRSDNTATDLLLRRLGRDRVDAMARRAGADPRSLPVLVTREAFAIKADPALSEAWRTGDAAARRRLLADPRLAKAPDPSAFSAKPNAIDAVEWFASPRAMAATLDLLRREGGPEAQAIMAVNSGADPTTARRFAFLGYKGGSEPGVIALDWLARTPDGRWIAVTGHWNRADATVDEARFGLLMTRLLALAATRP